jgi:peptidoglycan/LPS O-acetylase OafA/YrhL
MINPGFWFFTVLLQAYIIMPLIFIVTKGDFTKILVMGIVGGTMVKLLGIALYSTQDSPISLMLLPYFWQNNFIGSYWLQLCLGLYWGFIFLSKKGFRPLDYLVSIQFFILGIFLLVYLPTRGIEVLYKLGIDMLLTPFSFLALFWILYSIESHQLLERLFAPLLQGLSILGKYSYQIYLLHQPLYFISLSEIANILPVNTYLKPLLVFMIIMPILALYVTIFIQLENWVIKMIPVPKVFRPK